MKNHPLINPETGKEEWISRAIAVVVFYVAQDKDGEQYILVTQRGKGTPDPEYVGKYCVPCGYLDYDETIQEAVIRELYEETGVRVVSTDEIEWINFNDDPKSDKRQNVTFRFRILSNIPKEETELSFTTEHSEKDEVDSIRFIRISDVDMYDWAFNHSELIKKYV